MFVPAARLAANAEAVAAVVPNRPSNMALMQELPNVFNPAAAIFDVWIRSNHAEFVTDYSDPLLLAPNSNRVDVALDAAPAG